MLRGWHGHNGVSLGNPRLGFVATSQTTDGQPGLVGYYIEEDYDLEPEDRVRFRPGERPPGSAADLPSPSWDPVRLAKVERNYAMNYIHTILPAMTEELGPGTTSAVASVVGRQIAMQFHPSVMKTLGVDGDLGLRLGHLLAGHGDRCEVAQVGHAEHIRLHSWRLFNPFMVPAAVFDSWNALWEGFALMEDRPLSVTQRLARGDPRFEWVTL